MSAESLLWCQYILLCQSRLSYIPSGATGSQMASKLISHVARSAHVLGMNSYFVCASLAMSSLSCCLKMNKLAENKTYKNL